MFEEENRNWEAELQARADELLAGRLNPLKAELERLQTSFTGTCARLLEQAQPAAGPAAAGLVDHVREWLGTSAAEAEQKHQAELAELTEKLEQARAVAVEAAAAAARQETLQEAEAGLQKRLAQAAIDAAAVARRESEDQLDDLRGQLEASRQALTFAVSEQSQQAQPAKAAAGDAKYVGLIKAAIEEIDAQRTQSETLTALIRHAAHLSPRVAFFVVKSGEAVGWKASGFANGLTDETVRTLSVSIQAQTLLSDGLRSQQTAIALSPSQADLAAVLGRFTHPVPQGAVAVPLVVRGKAAAVLYADSGAESDESIQLDAIETLMRLAGMAIELLPIRRGAEAARPTAPAPVAPPPPQPVPPAPPVQTGPLRMTVEAPPVAPPAPEPNYSAQDLPPQRTTSDLSRHNEPVRFPAERMKWAEQEPPAPPVKPLPEPSAPSFDASPWALNPALQEVPEERTPNYYPPSFEARPAAGFEPRPAPVPAAGFEPRPTANYDTQEAPVPQLPEAEIAPPPPTETPSWMQRLQEEPEPPAPANFSHFSAPPPAPPVASWLNNEGFTSAATPPPPPPPPLRAVTDWSATPTARIPKEDEEPPPTTIEEVVPSIQFPAPPPPPDSRFSVPSLSISSGATETEVRAHNDARRFARLLVSEIKLYNAAKVSDGRRYADLYGRLRDEIDRSRKVYDKRVSPAVAAKFDYFYDELVQTLAEGDSAKLGDCPGPAAVA